MAELRGNFLDTSEIIATARTGKAADLRRTLKAKARKSLYWTSKQLFNYNRLTQGFHLELCQHIQETQKDQRRVYLVPRGWYKSTIVGKTYPMWRLMGGGLSEELQRELLEIEFKVVPEHARSMDETERLLDFYASNQELDPRNHRILILSETQDVANKDINDPKWHLLNNQQFKWLFPELVPENTNATVWNNSEILLPRSRSYDESTITALGLETGGTGFHYTIIIYDDIAGEKAAASPPLMEKAKERVKAAPGLLDDQRTSEELGAMTRWKHGTADVPGWMMEEMPLEKGGEGRSSGFHFYVKEAEFINEQGVRQSRFPERFPIEVLDQLLKREKPYLYNCNYMNRPSSPEGSDFDPTKWKEFAVERNPDELMMGKEVWDWIQPLGVDGKPEGMGVRLRNLYRIGFYDPSSGGKSAKCEGALAVVGADNAFRIFVFDGWSKNCGYQEALEQYYRFNDQYMLHARFYEDVGAQKEIETITSMRSLHKQCPFCGVEHRRFNLEPFKPGTKNKEERIRLFMQGAYDEGRIYFRQGLANGEARRQVTGLPHYPLVDLADAIASGIKNLRIPTTEEEQAAHELQMQKHMTPPATRTHTQFNYGGYV